MMMRAWPWLAALLAGGCSPPERVGRDPFTATGQLIALSGGAAGAHNACINCHGLNGEGNGAGAPRLAGIGRGYMVRQLELYGEGQRRHGRMHHIAKKLGWTERQAVSAYYDRLSAALPTGPAPLAPSRLYHGGDPARGIPACAGCHGEQGQGVGYGNPPLAGQPAAYLAQQHIAWARGERRGGALGVMLHVSQAMTPAEIVSVSRYAAALPGAGPRPE